MKNTLKKGDLVYCETKDNNFYARVKDVRDNKVLGVKHYKSNKVFKVPLDKITVPIKFVPSSVLLHILALKNVQSSFIITDRGVVGVHYTATDYCYSNAEVSVRIDITPLGHWNESVTLSLDWESTKTDNTRVDLSINSSGSLDFMDNIIEIAKIMYNLGHSFGEEHFKNLLEKRLQAKKEFAELEAKEDQEAKEEFLKTHRPITLEPNKWLKAFEKEARGNDGEAQRTIFTWGKGRKHKQEYRTSFTGGGALKFRIGGESIKKSLVTYDFPDVYEEI